MNLTHITDHVARSLARIAQQLRSSVSHAGLVTAFVAELQEAEDAIYGLIAGRALATATGVQLDKLGILLKEPRSGADDAPYRLRLQARILINRGSGTRELIIQVLFILTGQAVIVTNYEPAAFIAQVSGVEDSGTTSGLLQDATAGGVRSYLLYATTDADHVFTLDGTPDQSLDAGLLSGLV
jgi:hypothetical protein